jgi:ABC-type branched-subunit amino acid transport system ATPase component/uncharacterized RDD family membrane protein YckC
LSSDVKPTRGAPVKSVNLHVGEIAPGVAKVDPIIVADKVTRTFGGLTAVDVDHVEVPRNAITALIGPNGAGKTTFFNLLTGFDKPDTGSWTLITAATSGVYAMAGHPPAALGRRLGAFVIDYAIFVILALLTWGTWTGGFASDAPLASFIFGGIFLVLAVIFLVNQLRLTATQGVTIGKRALGLKVLSVTTEPGTTIGWGRALLRGIILGLVSLVSPLNLILLLSPLFDKSGRKRGWHDLAAGSEVFAPGLLMVPAPAGSLTSNSLAGMPSYKVARRGMVRTFQLTKALSLLSVLDNMKLGARGQLGEDMFQALFPFLWNGQEEDIDAKAMELLGRFKLDMKSEDYAASLSGGQRKLLEMARALMSDPELVMLDEPMAGVNPALTQSLLDHILDLKTQGMTVLFVEHDMQVVRHIADWVIVMAEGKIVAEGSPEAVMANPAVIDAYLGSHHDQDLGETESENVVAIKELLDADDES